MKNIISASRRTDIPAFYADWFTNRLKAGFVYVKNPYSGKVSHVSLKPSVLHSIFFCSKNYFPLIRKIKDVEKVTTNLFFHFTITGMPRELELSTPETSEAVKDFKWLSKRYSPRQVVWRFDPITITDKLDFEYFEESFRKTAGQLKGYSNQCYMSFVCPYNKTIKNFKRYTDQTLIDITPESKKIYAKRLSELAEGFGFRLYSCCNDALLSGKINKGQCINGAVLAEIFDDFEVNLKPTPTRDGCGCTKAVDIGSYDSCPHGCIYCYANTDKEKAMEFQRNHDPEWNGLGFNVDEITEEKGCQTSLF